jgi:hypothetical protein
MPERYVQQGGCLCGAVRDEITGAPMLADACHCRNRQRRSGAADRALPRPRAAMVRRHRACGPCWARQRTGQRGEGNRMTAKTIGLSGKIAFLASDAASLVTGAGFMLDGGYGAA